MVLEKQLRVEAGIDLDQVGRVLNTFQREDLQTQYRGVFFRIGTPNDCMNIYVRATQANVLIRISSIIKGGRYV